MANHQGPFGRLRYPDAYIDDQAYFIGRRVGNTIILYCQERWSQMCPGTGELIDGQFRLTIHHIHINPARLLQVQQFSRALYRAVTTELRNLTRIWDDVSLRFIDVIDDINYANVRESMRRWRREVVLPPAESLPQFRDLLYNDQYRSFRHCNGGYVEVEIQHRGTNMEILMIHDPILAVELTNTHIVFIDVSTAFTPAVDNVRRTVTITAIHNNYAFLYHWTLMASDSIDSYRSIIQRIRQLFPQVRQIFSNFEHNLHTSLMNSIPQPVMARGSVLKYCTILYQKAVEYEIPINVDNDTVILKIMGLAIIDPNDVITTFIAIRKGLSMALIRVFNLFLTYYELYWLREIGPQNFTAYNNIAALYDCQRASTNTLQHHPPGFNLWEYLRTIIVNCEKLHNDLGRLRDGARTLHHVPRVRPILHLTVVQGIWRSLETRSMTIAEALAAISFELTGLLDQFRWNNEQMPEDFQLLNSNQVVPAYPWNEDGVAPMHLGQILQRNNYRMRARPQVPVRAHGGRVEAAAAAPSVVQNEGGVADAQQADLPLQQLIPEEWMMDMSCIICYNARRNRIFTPCGHIILCDSCVTLFVAHEAENHPAPDGPLCPVCYRKVINIIPAYVI